MKEFGSVNDILEFAICQEQEAVEFYSDLASKMKIEAMRIVFNQFAQEEMGHKAKLLDIKEKGIYEVSSEIISDLKISDYLVKTPAANDMTYQEALVLAMNKEKSSFKLYLNLSERAPNAELKSLFLMLAQEESKHKLRFEIEYDDMVLKEN
ncbi:MAG: ferritin family protein [Bacteroidetes bacterium]|nr:ferritin family protein [Bacteroidota bacterium]